MSRLRWWVRCGLEIVVQSVLLALAEWSVRRDGVPATCHRSGIELRMDGSAAGPMAVLPQRYRAAVRAAGMVTSVWPFGDTCLRRCLLLGRRMRDLRPVLRIGIRQNNDKMLAHSWLEIEGRSLDPTAGDFDGMRQVGEAGR